MGNINEDIPNQSINFDTETRTGLIAGIWGEIPLIVLDGFAVRADILYTQKGAEYDIFNERVVVKADELTLTPFLVYYFPTGAARPFIEAGPELGLNVSDGKRRRIVQFNGNWKDTNFPLNLGGGIDFKFGGTSLMLEARYNYGMVNMGSWDSNALGGKKQKRTVFNCLRE
ncbi:MAG: PorT family protein [bacterium]|nr:PorT family protein [bacterium]